LRNIEETVNEIRQKMNNLKMLKEKLNGPSLSNTTDQKSILFLGVSSSRNFVIITVLHRSFSIHKTVVYILNIYWML